MRNIYWFVFLVIIAITAAGSRAEAFEKGSLVFEKCTGCHEVVGGKVSKVEDLRTTPEEWTVIVDRMSRLYGLTVTRDEMDRLLKELCSTQMLSPEELDRVSYLNLYNNPQTVEQPAGKEQEKLFAACVRCHSAGKIFSYRMTPERWGKMREFHLYQVPSVLYQLREMNWMEEAEGILKYLAKTLPYGGPRQAQEANPAGSYLILGYEPGKGNYRGEATVKALGRDDYSVNGSLAYDDGTKEAFHSEGTLYGGHAFRTRGESNGGKTFGAYAFLNGELRGQRHFRAPDFRTSSSTWYPANGTPRLLKVTPSYLLKGEKTTLRLEGISLPKGGEVSFSDRSVQVLSAKRVGEGTIEVVAKYLGKGGRSSAIRVQGLESAPITLAERIDSLRIVPEVGRARIDGGKNFPPEGVQFEALAYAGKSLLGPVPATFKLTPQHKRPNDDDINYVGGITPSGKQIPSGSFAPIATREFHKEATGLVNVEAQYTRGKRHYRAKAQLVVTLPDFVPRIK